LRFSEIHRSKVWTKLGITPFAGYRNFVVWRKLISAKMQPNGVIQPFLSYTTNMITNEVQNRCKVDVYATYRHFLLKIESFHFTKKVLRYS